jgi:predicted nucleotidyltransferase
MISIATIRDMTDLIVARFDPERVVLFGSFARGEATEDSDVDLLVELGGDELLKGRGNPIHHALALAFRQPTDVILRTSDEVRKFRDNPYTVIHRAFSEGIVLYERNAG